MDFVPGTVATGFCSSDFIDAAWRSCYTNLLMADSYRSDRRIVAEYSTVTGAVGIPKARCKIVGDFLEGNAEWLWFTDTDSTFAPNIIETLLQAADPKDRPIMGGLAFRIDYGTPNAVGAAKFELEPTIYYYDGEKYFMVHKYPKDAIIRCSGVGAHCLLIHRSVLADPGWLQDGHYYPWFRMSTKNGKELSEDLYFCDKAQELGYPIHVCTAAKTGHIKSITLDEDLYLSMHPDYLEAMTDPNWHP